MVKGLYTAWTGMVNAQKRLDVLSNNLANADTTGYKKEGTTTQSFDNKLALKIKDTSSIGYARRLGTVHLGVKIGETYTDSSQGAFQVTDNPSDVAIAGTGFFAFSMSISTLIFCNTSSGILSLVNETRDVLVFIFSKSILLVNSSSFILATS